MRKAPPIKIKFVFIGSQESEKRLGIIYDRIFDIARRNLILADREKSKRSKLLLTYKI